MVGARNVEVVGVGIIFTVEENKVHTNKIHGGKLQL